MPPNISSLLRVTPSHMGDDYTEGHEGCKLARSGTIKVVKLSIGDRGAR
jgi:hypothetical protein